MNLAPHLGLETDEIGHYVLLPGDPGRCEVIASFFEQPRFVAQQREFRTYTGFVAGAKVSVTSTGIGCPSTAIAVEELSALGAHTFIRIGTAGGMQPVTELGDLVITHAAVRHEDTSPQYIPLAFPAIADLSVTRALARAAQSLGIKHHIGISHSKDSFYGEVEPERMPVAQELRDDWTAWLRGGVLCSEMEASTLFTVARVLRRRAGGVMLIAGLTRELQQDTPRRLTEQEREQATRNLAQVGVESVRRLIEADRGSAER